MPIEVNCTSCGQRLRAPDNAAGKAIRCPHCQNVMDVPESAASSPSSAGAKRDAWRIKTHDGSEYGPVPKSELDQWVREGRLDARTQVQQEGTGQWQWASSVYPQLAGGRAPSHSPGYHTPSTSAGTNPFAERSLSPNPYAASSGWSNSASAPTGPRPLSGGVIAVAVINFIFGGLGLLSGLCILAAGAGAMPIWGRDFAVIMMLLIIVIAALYIVGGIGLMQRAEWGRVITFVLAGLSILGIILSFVALVNAIEHNVEEVVFSQLISILVSGGYVILVFTVLTSRSVTNEFRDYRSRRYRR